MSATQGRAPGTQLLAAVVLSACVGLVGGGLGAWGVYTHFGPVERVITETKTGGGAISVGDIATAVQPSLVSVSTQSVSATDLATGSAGGLTEGFAVSTDGLIVTSAHAVRGATRLRVGTSGGRAYDATIAASDLRDGLVVLRATGASGMTPLHIATADPRIGDLAVAVFQPALDPLTTRSGVVAAIGMTANDGTADLAALVTVDATPAPSADGAPLVDGTGAVIGVVTTVPSSPGIVAASGRAVATLVGAVQRGTPTSRATLGVTSVLLTGPPAAAAGLPQGALVEAVDPAGPAAGLLRPGDVVTTVNATGVAATGGLLASDYGLLAGDTAVLHVTGPDGAARTVTLSVGTG